MARTGDRGIRIVSGGVSISGFVGIFILNEPTRRITRGLKTFSQVRPTWIM